ncbi:hypothetical protein, partial [Gilliamella sp. Pas-s95]|uniref:hypothetical protein n=1 Tax=Gilliamella sp. Pas-s95 TaxID=2687317 RepID=UPI001F1C52A0
GQKESCSISGVLFSSSLVFLYNFWGAVHILFTQAQNVRNHRTQFILFTKTKKARFFAQKSVRKGIDFIKVFLTFF